MAEIRNLLPMEITSFFPKILENVFDGGVFLDSIDLDVFQTSSAD